MHRKEDLNPLKGKQTNKHINGLGWVSAHHSDDLQVFQVGPLCGQNLFGNEVGLVGGISLRRKRVIHVKTGVSTIWISQSIQPEMDKQNSHHVTITNILIKYENNLILAMTTRHMGKYKAHAVINLSKQHKWNTVIIGHNTTVLVANYTPNHHAGKYPPFLIFICAVFSV